MSERKPLVLILHGPSGVGKDTVIERLREVTGIHRATSSTSRPPREHERHGVDYYFLAKDEFERKMGSGDFIEHAVVYGDWKGMETAEILRHLEAGHDLIIRTDVQGARSWRRMLEGAIQVMLVAEDVDALRRRLEGRGSEDEDSLEARLAELDEELADRPNNEYVVVNKQGNLDETVAEIARIIEIERANTSRPMPRLRTSVAD